MSAKELKRAGVLARVRARTLALTDAAVLMGVCYRQAPRLWRMFRRRGPIGLRHHGVGRRSNRRKPAAFWRRIVRLVKREFGGDATHERFGPTLAAEHLRDEYQLAIDPETLRRWMLAAGLWSRVRAAPPHRGRRERKAHFGELVQPARSDGRSLTSRSSSGSSSRRSVTSWATRCRPTTRNS